MVHFRSFSAKPGGRDHVSISAPSWSVTTKVQRHLLRRTLNIASSLPFLILTDLASFRPAVSGRPRFPRFCVAWWQGVEGRNFNQQEVRRTEKLPGMFLVAPPILTLLLPPFLSSLALSTVPCVVSLCFSLLLGSVLLPALSYYFLLSFKAKEGRDTCFGSFLTSWVEDLASVPPVCTLIN